MRLSIVVPKLIYRFNTIVIKIPGVFIVETDKLILKFMWDLGYLK